MSFTVRGVRGRRGIGAGGVFMSEMTARAGEAIGTAIAAGRSTTMPSVVGTRSDTFVGEGLGPVETPAPLGGADVCDCLVASFESTALEAGVAEADIVGGRGAVLAECEADPVAFDAMLREALGATPNCLAWYQNPVKRNVAIGVGAAVLLGVAGVAILRRR